MKLNKENLTIYSIYLRNHGNLNNFKLLKNDLSRIKNMNFDSIWLLPIHQIGEKNKKGNLGCPYSIKDYNSINPEYGNIEDFKSFIDEAHNLGIKIIIDVVYNHTSYDSVLYNTHPEFFLKDKNNNPISKVDDWSDVIDLDFNNKELWNHLIDSLKKWSLLGVDGFRCDVASLVEIEFWKKAKSEIKKINPNTIWIGESMHIDFINELNDMGYKAYDDIRLYESFDILYDYDVHPEYEKFVEKKITLDDYINTLINQSKNLPKNYIKLRFIENHDQKRMASIVDKKDKINLTVLSYMLNGATLVYAGQETLDTHTPSLFEKEKINLDKIDLSYSSLITKLNAIKKDKIFINNSIEYTIIENEALKISYNNDELISLINFGEKEINYTLNSKYKDLLNNNLLEENSTITLNTPYILKLV